MPKYTDDEIRNMKKITCKIAGEYLGISSMAVSMGIHTIKHKPERVFLKLREVDPEGVCISAVTYAELVHGVEKSAAVERNRVALSMLLANIEILDFDTNAANCYGKIRADLEKKGTPIGSDLRIENWAE